jgi:hypothetical protein
LKKFKEDFARIESEVLDYDAMVGLAGSHISQAAEKKLHETDPIMTEKPLYKELIVVTQKSLVISLASGFS